MQTQVTFLTRRARGGVNRKETSVSGEVLRFGRSTSCEVFLSDIRVALEQAQLSRRDSGAFISAMGDASLRVNGAVANSAALKVGDKIDIGPYQIVIEQPPAGFDYALTFELVTPLGDDLARLQSHSALNLAAGGVNRRTLSWALAVIVLLLFIALPILANFVPGVRDGVGAVAWRPDVVWDTGTISNSHGNFATQCESCHVKPFVMVQDAQCLTCHKAIEHHVDTKTAQVPSLDQTRCATCHKEHNGPNGAIVTEQSLCSDCHTRIKNYAASTELLDAGDFLKDHPEFRVTVVENAATGKLMRASIETKPKDLSGLIFPHDKHLPERGIPSPDGNRRLVCADCHKPEPGGVGMLPITYAANCDSCHKAVLQFEQRAPERKVPHGDPLTSELYIRDYYARAALDGGYDDVDAPAAVRRRPGTPLALDQRGAVLAWANMKAEQAFNTVFDPRRGCGYCHAVTRKVEGQKVSYEAPLKLIDRFMPKGKFDHGKHTTMTCVDCHDATKSSVSSDVLLPGIANCRNCHGGESSASKVQSTCISCHEFHRDGLPPMRAPTTSEVAR